MSDERLGDEEEEGVPPLIGVAVVAACVAVLALMVLLIPALRDATSSAIHGDTDALRSQLNSAGGVAVLYVLALMHTVIWYPAEILDAAAGYVWGFGPGLAIMMGAWMLNCWAAWEVGHRAARPLLYRLVGHDRFLAYERAVERGGIPLLLGIRVVPIVPFSLFTMVVGAARVPLRRVLWTTAVGYIPITALFVYFGSQLEELSPTDPILIVGAIVLIAAIVIAHRMRGRLEDPEPADAVAAPAEATNVAETIDDYEAAGVSDEPVDASDGGVGELAAERDPDRDDLLGV
jgi:uncharacterized membrane protein YdjX (TVP38/TMEM64 family)